MKFLAALLLAGSIYAQQQDPAPCLKRPIAERSYSRATLIRLAAGSQSVVRAEFLILTCGVGVPLTGEFEKELRNAGAGDRFIEAVKRAAPKPPPAKRIESTHTKPAPPAGKIVSNHKDEAALVYIPPGSFQMGCSDEDKECRGSEKPVHPVRITRGFWLDQTEVTVDQFKRFVRDTGRRLPDEPKFGTRNLNPGWNNDSVPMTMVSWNDAHDYCEWAGLRLPSEAEWEYAARGGTAGALYGPPHDIAWFADNSGDKRLNSQALWNDDRANYPRRLSENGNRPRTVGKKQMNAFKLHDMLGSVWEWTADWYKDTYYSESPVENPRGAPRGDQRIVRGGSWDSYPSLLRVSRRIWLFPKDRVHFVGFRCGGDL